MCNKTVKINVDVEKYYLRYKKSYSKKYLLAYLATSIVGEQSLKQLMTVERAQSKQAGVYQ